MTHHSRRRPRERTFAGALTLAMILLLFMVAGMARFTQNPGQMLELAFDRALVARAPAATPPPVVSRPGPRVAGPSRAAIDPVLLAARSPVATTRDARTMLPSRTLSTARRDIQPQERQATLAARRSLLPRTRLPGRATRRVTLDASRAPDARPTVPAVRATTPRLEARRAEVRDVPDPLPADLLEEGVVDPLAIIEWVRRWPGGLPPAIRRHIDYTDDALSSVDTLVQDNQTDELYLMGRPLIRELHIVLVRGERSYYFIDRGGRQEGHKFRVGTVRREEGVIAGIVSEDRPLDSPEAQLLFQVILSWWNGVADEGP